ncbi:MAG: Wzz/FepE/Etk N-terminal domain-containing protein [Acidiferrobacteraceae bacterium]
MNFTQYLLILAARKWAILGVLLVCVMTTTVITLLLPKQYTATASVVVDFKSKDPITGQVLPVQLLPGYLATQVDIIKSRNVALKVIHDLHLATNPGTEKQFMRSTQGKGDIHNWLARLLLKRLVVKPERESSVVNVSFTTTQPQFSALMANTFVKAYMETNLELQEAPEQQTAAWFDQQTHLLRRRLQAAQEKLSDYERAHGIPLTPAAGALTRPFSVTRAPHRASEEGLAAPGAVNRAVVQNIKVLLVRSEGRLARLGESLGRHNPRYLRAEAEVSTLKARLGAASRSLDPTASLLQRDVDNYQRIYDNAMQRYGQVSMEAAYNQTAAAVLNPAIPPTAASTPKTFRNIAVSIVLGSMLGLGLALLLEMIDRRVRSGQDIVVMLMIPVLAELSEPVPRFQWLLQWLRRWVGPSPRASV